MTALRLKIGTSNVLELRSLTNSVTGAPVTDATVSATISDRSGDAVPGESYPVLLAHDTNGTYRAVLAHDISIVDKRKYWVDLEALAPGGEKLTIRDEVLAEYEDGQ